VKFYVEFYNLSGVIIVTEIENTERSIKMASILPVSDLRNYNEVLKKCRVDEPVFLTKNGRGRFVVLDIDDYERERAEKKLLVKLQEAEEAVKDGEGWLTVDE
jgi:prevent-host-death family protein